MSKAAGMAKAAIQKVIPISGASLYFAVSLSKAI